MPPVSSQELKAVVALKDQPDDVLQWILDNSDYHEYEDGTCVRKLGDPQDELYFILEGSLNFFMDVNGRQVYYFTFANDIATGGVSGLLPYSRMKTSPGYAYAVDKLRAIMIHKDHFHELERRSPDLIQRLVGYMTERARLFATVQLQHEKVSALGKLSAGIAHELNNPAAAISRISSDLSDKLQLNYQFTEQLLRDGIHAEVIENVRRLVEAKVRENRPRLTAMQKLQKEDSIRDWLETHARDLPSDIAETFIEANFSEEELESIRINSDKNAFPELLRWLENLISSQGLVKDLAEASSRISNLVGAIKSHVQMDRTNDLHPTNIHTDLDNTITLLGYKLREKNITVTKTYCEQLAEVPAYVGELNQVWTNIIDNAIYAIDKNGELSIETTCNSKNVKVKIIDNGAGIPKEIMSRIFDPFFTTKKVGQGTGIGLDIVNRIVKRHNGEIKVQSAPGRTEFEICLPLKPSDINTPQN
ncbi:MAG TPA: ATP-binding protein [Flavitalea sp.]|nr:ATP-binding protein [Flavitalea sp.]